MKIFYFYILCLFFLLSGCEETLPVEWSDGKYQVVWDGEHRTLVKKLDENSLLAIIQPNVIAIGSNHCTIIAKQKNDRNGGILFFIISKQNNASCSDLSDVERRPLSEETYNELKAQHSLPEFSISFVLP